MTVVLMPVAGFIAVTLALGTEAPVESVTIPVIVPLFPNCPKTRLAKASNAISGPQSNLKQLCFIPLSSLRVSLLWLCFAWTPAQRLLHLVSVRTVVTALPICQTRIPPDERKIAETFASPQ